MKLIKMRLLKKWAGFRSGTVIEVDEGRAATLLDKKIATTELTRASKSTTRRSDASRDTGFRTNPADKPVRRRRKSPK